MTSKRHSIQKRSAEIDHHTTNTYNGILMQSHYVMTWLCSV